MTAEHRLAAALEVIDEMRAERARAISALKLAEEQLSIMADERDSIEAAHADTVRKWQRELATKCIEMEEIAKRVPTSSDLQKLRASLVEEVHAEVRSEMARIKDEAERASATAAKLREENLALVTDAAAKARVLEVEREKERVEAMTKIRDLEYQLDQARAALAVKGDTVSPTATKLQTQVAELELKMTHLLAENEDLRTAKAELGAQLDAEKRNHSRQQLEYKSALESMKVDRDLVTAKLTRAHEEQQVLINKSHEHATHLASVQVELAAARRALDDKSHQHAATVFSLQSEHAQDRVKWERAHREIEARRDAAAAELELANKTLEEMRTEARVLEARAAEAARAAPLPEHLEELRHLRQQNAELKSQLGSLQGQLDEQRTHFLAEKESLLHKLNGLKATVDELQHDLDDTKRQASDTEATLARTREVEAALREEAKRTRAQLDTTMDELTALREAEAWNRPQHEEDVKRLDELRHQVAELKSTLKNERDEALASMQDAKAVWLQSQQSLTTQLNTITAEHTQLKDAYSKLKATAQGKLSQYKSAVAELETKLHACEARCAQLSGELAGKREREASSRRETSKHRKEFLDFLRREMSTGAADVRPPAEGGV
ncbi:establishment of centrosome localization [Blastocladiella emersonii ATCC 22665]|nr:establishment of centrosome localization [Blastocladiella emersonii ATCC 22665]